MSMTPNNNREEKKKVDRHGREIPVTKIGRNSISEKKLSKEKNAMH